MEKRTAIEKNTIFYKSFTADLRSVYRRFNWPLPVNGAPGEWLPAVEGELELCTNGYHACKRDQIVYYLDAVLAEVEFAEGSELLHGNNKVCGRGPARVVRLLDGWNNRTQRLFACDCAEHVLPLFESTLPNDTHPRSAIKVARRFANGEASQEELFAARDAALDAVGDAALASTKPVIRSVAEITASFAAWSTAQFATALRDEHASGSTSSDAERRRQTEQLFKLIS